MESFLLNLTDQTDEWEISDSLILGLKDHLKDGAKVLDIGSGSGYLTACFAVMAGPNAKVIGIDHIQELVDWSEKNIRKNNSTLIDSGRIKLVVGDGHFGFEEEGPYHVIHVGAADSGIPQSVRF